MSQAPRHRSFITLSCVGLTFSSEAFEKHRCISLQMSGQLCTEIFVSLSPHDGMLGGAVFCMLLVQQVCGPLLLPGELLRSQLERVWLQAGNGQGCLMCTFEVFLASSHYPPTPGNRDLSEPLLRHSHCWEMELNSEKTRVLITSENHIPTALCVGWNPGSPNLKEL